VTTPAATANCGQTGTGAAAQPTRARRHVVAQRAPMGDIGFHCRTATMLLVNTFCGRLQHPGDVCPWKCSSDTPTCSMPSGVVHRLPRDNATHTARSGAFSAYCGHTMCPAVRNKDGQHLQAASPPRRHGHRPWLPTVWRDLYKGKGVVLDMTVRAPTASKYLAGKSNAATKEGTQQTWGKREDGFTTWCAELIVGVCPLRTGVFGGWGLRRADSSRA